MRIETPFGAFKGKTIGMAAAVIVLLLILLMLKPFKIINDTEEGAQVTWSGLVKPEPMKAGFHWMNPFNSVSTIPLTYQNFKLDDVGVPARDGFKTSMDMAITGQFIPGAAPMIRKDTGSAERFIQTHVVRRLNANLIEAGKKYAKVSQDFYNETTLNEVRDDVIRQSNEELNPLGFRVTAIEFSDLNLPPVIMDAITKAKVQAENVKRQNESLQIAALKAQEVEKIADSNSKATIMNADAAKYKAEKEADAKLYAAAKEAAGNKEIASSVTPALVQYMDAQAKLKWDGALPTTNVGGNTPIIMNTK